MPCVVQRHLPGHRDVRQGLLQSKNVPAHPLNARLVYDIHILCRADQYFRYQVPQTLEYILKSKIFY